MPSNILINQSMLKDLVSYQKEELCGLIFMNKWINQQFGRGSKANNLGDYFEYLCTGAIPKNATEPPKPLYNKNGSLDADYQMAKYQSEYFLEIVNKFGIKILKNGHKLSVDDKYIGTIDIEAKWEGIFKDEQFSFDTKNKDKIVIIDLKFTALIDDMWNDLGWNIRTLSKKHKTLLQAKHYKYLYWKKYGFNPPFLFFVFSSKEHRVAKLINVDIPTYELENHELFLEKARLYLSQQLKKGFEPIPKYENCQSCAYNSWCIHKIDIPEIINIIPE